MTGIGAPPALPVWLAAWAMAGAIAGSFLATLLVRMPQGKADLFGRSRCDVCLTVLGPVSLVPLLSFVWQRGRCRACGAQVAREHFIVELLAAVIGLIAAWHFPDRPLTTLGAALFGWQLLLLGALDLRWHWLPDRLSLILAATGLAFNASLVGLGWQASLLGLVTGFGALEGLRLSYRALRGVEGMGQGDPKLLGALGAWTGWELLPRVVLIGALGGLAIVLGLRLIGRTIDARSALPLGTMLAFGGWTAWLFAQPVMN